MTTQQHAALWIAYELEIGTFVPNVLQNEIVLRQNAAAELRRQHARITELESQLAQRFDAADMATAAAQGFRDGVAKEQQAGAFQAALDIRTAQGWKLGGDKAPVLYTDEINGQQVCRDDVWLCTTDAFTHPSPPEGMAGWISVKDRLPEKNTEVLIFFAELSIPSTGQYTASALDHEGWCYPQENHLWPGERPDFEDGGSPTVTHWMPLPAAPGPADGESNG